MKKIKLLHITSSLKTGGAEKLLCDLITHLDPIFDHEVIYFHDGPHRKTIEAMNIQTHHIEGVVSIYDPIFFSRLYKLTKKINPDIIHTQLWAGNNAGRIVGKLLNKPVISVLHNYLDQDGAIRNFIDQRTLNLSTKLVAYSDGIAQSLIKRDPQYSTHKISILDIGIDREQLMAHAARSTITRADFDLNQSHFVIGSVGRFVPVRRYDLMIDAFNSVHKKYAHARLMLVGIGELEQSLRDKVNQLNLQDKVIFVIGQPGYNYYTLFNCFSLTTDKEGPSLALLEAMSFGIPCVRTNIEKVHPVIEHEINGLIVPAGDARALADAYFRIIEDQQFAHMIGANGNKTVENKFDIKTSAHAFEKVLQSVINS
jgi:glycosyltransferase involved in cell wall biosynthesis